MVIECLETPPTFKALAVLSLYFKLKLFLLMEDQIANGRSDSKA